MRGFTSPEHLGKLRNILAALDSSFGPAGTDLPEFGSRTARGRYGLRGLSLTERADHGRPRPTASWRDRSAAVPGTAAPYGDLGCERPGRHTAGAFGITEREDGGLGGDDDPAVEGLRLDAPHVVGDANGLRFLADPHPCRGDRGRAVRNGVSGVRVPLTPVQRAVVRGGRRWYGQGNRMPVSDVVESCPRLVRKRTPPTCRSRFTSPPWELKLRWTAYGGRTNVRTKDDMNANGIDQEAVADVGGGADDRVSRGMSAPKALVAPWSSSDLIVPMRPPPTPTSTLGAVATITQRVDCQGLILMRHLPETI